MKVNSIQISHKRSANISPGSGSGSPVEDEATAGFHKGEIVKLTTKAGSNYLTNQPSESKRKPDPSSTINKHPIHGKPSNQTADMQQQ